MILDSSFIIDFIEGDANARKKLEELELEGTKLATTTLTAFELWRGFHELNQSDKEQACAILDRLHIYPLDLTSAKTGGRLAQALDAKGQTIDPEDTMIAGIIFVNKEKILTRNVKHFNRIPGLLVETY